ncbi:MAG: response regulator [Chitinophagaceae bacterium]|nr:MAG: response regulator [Chitinophagaceae bacterium]
MKSLETELNILIIEDHPPDAYIIEQMLRSSAFKVKEIHHAGLLSEAHAILEENTINFVLLDLSLPDSFGIDSFLGIRNSTRHIPVIVLTGGTESAAALKALQLGAQDYLVKGEFGTDMLTRAIRYSIERKVAAEKIRASEKKYRQMFYKNPFPAWIYDPESLQILEVNEAAQLKYGYSKQEFLKLTIADMRPPEEIPAMRLSVANRHLPQTRNRKVWKHKKKNGEIILTEVTFYEIDYHGKVAMQAQMDDVTERNRLEKELAKQQRENQQQINRAILDAQEEEKKLLGAELHDNINQILATAQLHLAPCEKKQADDMMARSRTYIAMAIEEIRKLSKSLITPLFITKGLEHAIEELATDIGVLKGIHIATELEPLGDPCLSELLKLNIYRIIQEQLNNIIKYADASEVHLQVTAAAGNLTLLISDNGKGFDPKIQARGVGMINIRNRAELFNGTVEVDSAPGKGCRIKVVLTLPVRSGTKRKGTIPAQ